MKLCHLQRHGWTVIQSDISEKEKNKYINAYIWNLEKWYR